MRWGILALLLLGAGCVGLAPTSDPSDARIDVSERTQEPPAGEEPAPESEPAAGGEVADEEKPAAGDEKPDDPKPKKPTKERLPGPEHVKLHYFVGTWKGKVYLRGSLFRDESRTTADIAYEKICKGFFVSHDYIQHASKKHPEDYTARGTMTYDPVARKYRMWWFDSRGQMQDGHGTWKNNVLRFEFDLRWGNRAVKMVNTYTIVSDSQYTLKMESGYADEPLDTVIEATYDKQP